MVFGPAGAHYLGVEERHFGEGALRAGEGSGKVGGLPGAGVPGSGDPPHHLSAATDGDSPRVGVDEEGHPLGPLQAPCRPPRCPRVVVAGGVEEGDSRTGEATKFPKEEPLGSPGEEFAVKEVSRHQYGVHLFGQGELDGPREGVAGGFPKGVPEFGGAPDEGGVEVQVGQVEETHGEEGRKGTGCGLPMRVRGAFTRERGRFTIGTTEGLLPDGVGFPGVLSGRPAPLLPPRPPP